MKRRELTESDMLTLLQMYQGVVYSALKKLGMYRSHQDFDDYYQEGCLQLFEAYEVCTSDPLVDANRYAFIHFLQKRLHWAFLDYMRKEKRLRMQETPADSSFLLEAGGAATFADTVETGSLLQDLLPLLHEQERAYLRDRIFQDLSMTEIAQKHRVSRKTVHEWRRRIQEKAAQLTD